MAPLSSWLIPARLPRVPRTTPVVVTGASSGIGRAVAERFAVAGHPVIGTTRNPKYVDAPVPGVKYLALDLADPSSIESFAGGALKPRNTGCD